MHYYWSVENVESIMLSELITRLDGKFGKHRFSNMECVRHPRGSWTLKGLALESISEDSLRNLLQEYGQVCIGN